MQPAPAPKFARPELLLAACYAALLLWLNLYIARDFFTAHTAHMNSMHGFWAAIAKRGGSGWFWPTWWPYWDCGIPFEAAYAPLVPAMTAACAALGSIPYQQAFGCVTGFFYCLGPLALFLMSWQLTHRPAPSFLAALVYSLTSATQLVLPDGAFHLTDIWQARRLYLAAVWDETPHMAAVSLLPLAILFLARSLERRRKLWYAAAAATIALMTLASAFGPVIATLAAACLLFVYRPQAWKRNLPLVAAIGAYAYLMAIAWVPPSVLRAIHESTIAGDREGWTVASLTALALTALACTVLWQLLKRSTKDWRIQLFALLAAIVFCLTFTADFLHRRLLPQAGRYRLELELALAWLAVFASLPLYRRLPTPVRRAAVFLLLALAAEQVAGDRKLEKEYLFPASLTATVEYRAAVWTQRNLPGTRVFFPGSMAQWANLFSDIPQFTGSSWSMATNQSQQKAYADIVFGSGPGIREISLTWLKAFGVGAVAVSAPHSAESWHPYADPSKFDGLPELWSESGVTIYRVPLRSTSLVHVVPPGAIVRHPPKNPEDAAEAARFVAALDDPSLPPAGLSWLDRNHIRIRAAVQPGQAVSVQVGYHPGWHATVNGGATAIYKDGLGLMWLRPECRGDCEIQLTYRGGWELWLCRVISYAAWAALPFAAAVP